MQLLLKDHRGQGTAVGAAISVIMSLAVGVIVLSQFFGAGLAPDATADPTGYAQWVRVETLSWAGISLLAVSIIVLAASVILTIVRGMGGAGV